MEYNIIYFTQHTSKTFTIIIKFSRVYGKVLVLLKLILLVSPYLLKSEMQISEFHLKSKDWKELQEQSSLFLISLRQMPQIASFQPQSDVSSKNWSRDLQVASASSSCHHRDHHRLNPYWQSVGQYGLKRCGYINFNNPFKWSVRNSPFKWSVRNSIPTNVW